MPAADHDPAKLRAMLEACSDIVDGSDRRRAAWHGLREAVPALLDRLAAAERDRDAKQRGYDDLHALTDPAVGYRDNVWSQVDVLIKRLATAEEERDRLRAILDMRDRRVDALEAALTEACDLAAAAIDNAPPANSTDDADMASAAAGHRRVGELRVFVTKEQPR